MNNRATYLGWFGTGRTIGYLLGPITGGVLLFYFQPKTLFIITGLISFLAFIPILTDRSYNLPNNNKNTNLKKEFTIFINKIIQLTKLRQIWIVGLIEWSFYAVFYSMKVFIPLYLVTSGHNTLIAGSFLTTLLLFFFF